MLALEWAILPIAYLAKISGTCSFMSTGGHKSKLKWKKS